MSSEEPVETLLGERPITRLIVASARLNRPSDAGSELLASICRVMYVV